MHQKITLSDHSIETMLSLNPSHEQRTGSFIQRMTREPETQIVQKDEHTACDEHAQTGTLHFLFLTFLYQMNRNRKTTHENNAYCVTRPAARSNKEFLNFRGKTSTAFFFCFFLFNFSLGEFGDN